MRVAPRQLIVVGIMVAVAGRAAAHDGIDHAARLTGANVWNGFTAVSILAIGILYGAGLWRLWSHAAGRETIRAWQAVAFTAGTAAAAVALLSPLDRWSDILFSAHMAQHEILMLISAPLMVAGRPFIAAMWALPAHGRTAAGSITRIPWLQRVWNSVSGPFIVLIIHALVLWIWHIPAMFEAALESELVHAVQHLGFFLTAALFWWTLIHGRYGRIGYGVSVFYVFATAMHTQILGALLTFGSRIWYPTHAARTASAGFDAADDQQLAGVLMWIPSGVIFIVVAIALFAAWLGEAERRVAFTTSEQIAREGRA